MTGESVRAEQAPRNGLTAPESDWDPGVGSPGGSAPGSGPQTGAEGFQPSAPTPLEISRDAAEALYAALGTLLGVPQGDRDAQLETLRNGASERAAILEETRDILEQAGYPQAHGDDWPRLAPAVSALIADLGQAWNRAGQAEDSLRRTNIELQHWQTVIALGLRAELDQLHRDCDARDETIRHLDAGLTRERERGAGLEAELVGVRSVVDRVRTLATQMRDWYDPHSVVSGWGRQALEALDAATATAPQAVVDETPAEAAQAADLPIVIHRTADQLRQQRAELIASTGLDETVLRERGETFQLYPEHADAWQTVQGIDYLLAGENGGEA